MNKFAILKEFLTYLKEHKKWWLAPVFLFLIILGALVLFAQTSPLAPFIYPLF